MKKELKLSDIKFSDIKDSPILISVVLVVFILAILACSGYYILDIFKIKDNIVAQQEEYQKSCEQIVYLQQVRSQNDSLVAQKDIMDKMLPPTEDVFVVMQNYYTLCDRYNIDVVSLETPEISSAYTTETRITLTVNGTYNNIISFLSYISNLQELHRIDQLIVEEGEEDGLKRASIVIIALSE
ncbi:MAG: Pilus assembly protein, PilO [Firmicutes bacterium ADurb.Bin300]|nr:MAG: Pilus assembly protein, PilO [Firmicutes bacterium ADurb.Bin300]HOD02725.1 type 4a pilus biogenesis protein PilO [Clostridiales bacterium]